MKPGHLTLCFTSLLALVGCATGTIRNAHLETPVPLPPPPSFSPFEKDGFTLAAGGQKIGNSMIRYFDQDWDGSNKQLNLEWQTPKQDAWAQAEFYPFPAIGFEGGVLSFASVEPAPYFGVSLNFAGGSVALQARAGCMWIPFSIVGERREQDVGGVPTGPWRAFSNKDNDGTFYGGLAVGSYGHVVNPYVEALFTGTTWLLPQQDTVLINDFSNNVGVGASAIGMGVHLSLSSLADVQGGMRVIRMSYSGNPTTSWQATLGLALHFGQPKKSKAAVDEENF